MGVASSHDHRGPPRRTPTGLKKATSLEVQLSACGGLRFISLSLRRTIRTPHDTRLFAFANVTLQALTCFCLFGRWPKIQATRAAGGRSRARLEFGTYYKVVCKSTFSDVPVAGRGGVQNGLVLIKSLCYRNRTAGIVSGLCLNSGGVRSHARTEDDLISR